MRNKVKIRSHVCCKLPTSRFLRLLFSVSGAKYTVRQTYRNSPWCVFERDSSLSDTSTCKHFFEQNVTSKIKLPTLWRNSPTRTRAASFLKFLDRKQQHATVGRTPLDEWSARRWDLYVKTHNTHKRQISMPPAGSEPATPASERPQTLALDRSMTGIGS